MRLLSKRDAYILHAAILIILLWVSVWNLTEELIDYVEEKTAMKKWQIYGILLALVLVVIILDPNMFEKL